MANLYIFIWLFICIQCTEGAVECMSCSRVAEPHDCENVVTCAQHEQCFTDFYITPQGHVFYDLGCASNRVCDALNKFGKREVKRQDENLYICQECCNSHRCNRYGCGDQNKLNRTICYSCNDVEHPSKCDTAAVCDIDKECYTKHFINDMFSDRYEMGCQHKEMCKKMMGKESIIAGHPKVKKQIIGGFDNIDVCYYCCDNNFCNKKDCVNGHPSTQQNMQTSPITTTVTTTTTKRTNPPTTQATSTTTTQRTQSPTTTTTTKVTHPPPTTKKVTHPPPTTTRVTHPPPKTTKVTHPPPTTTRVTHPPPKTTKVTHPPPTTKKVTHPPPTTKKVTHPPPTTKKVTHPPPTTTTIKRTHPPPTTTTTKRTHPPPTTTTTKRTHPPPTTTTTKRTHPPTTTTTTKRTTTPTPTTECFSQSSPGSAAQLTNCSGSTQYCVTYLHNYGNGYRETTKGCASVNECQKSLINTASGQCSVFSEDQLYTSDFKCTYCCTKDKCNGRIVPPHETMYTGHVTLPTPTIRTTTECLIKPSPSSQEVLKDCSGSTPYCITHFTNYNNGYRETTKGCASRATCDATKTGNKNSNDQCTYYDENFLYKSDFTCSYCCTKDICNTGILPPHETLYQP